MNIMVRERLGGEGSQSVTNCHRLKVPAADSKSYLTDVANVETLLYRIHGAPQILQTASAELRPGRKFQSAIGKSVFAQTSGQSAGTERLQSLSERSSADQERRALANIEALL